MRDLIELLRNTDTYMAISPCDIGLIVTFMHPNNGDPKKYEFIISDVDIGTLEVSLEAYIMSKLELLLMRLGIEITA